MHKIPPAIGLKCGSCTACCDRDLIVLHPECGDDPSRYDLVTVTHPFTRQPALAIRPREDGKPGCRYLSRDPEKPGCTIYHQRPAVCREFDCRKLVRSLTTRKMKLAIRRGLASREVFAAGRERMHTLDGDDG